MQRVFRDDLLDRTFGKEGYVVVPFLSLPQLEELRQVCGRLHQHELSPFHSTVQHESSTHRRSVRDAIELVCRARLQSLFADFKICIANFLQKEPGQQRSRVPMHVDWSFVDESSFLSVNVWCPLTDVTEENGCLHVVAGSEHHDVLIRPHAGKWLGAHPFHQVLPLLMRKYTRNLAMSAGHAIVYHARLLHGSGPNNSAHRRVAIGCALAPQQAPILHSVLLSPTQAEIFEVSADFFCTHALHERPQGVKSLGIVEHHVQQLTDDEIIHSPHIRP